MQTMRRRQRERGQTLAEFAMVLPVLALLIFGLIETARLYQSWVTIQHAAREGARYAVTGRETCDAASPTRLNCIEYTAREQAGSLTNTSTTMDVGVRSWDYPAYADPASEGSAGEQCDAVEVRVEYDFTPAIEILGDLFGSVQLVARERLVNEPFGPCA